METTDVVWCKPSVVFRVLTVRLVALLAGSSDMMEGRRFLSFLLTLLSFL